MRKFLQLWSLVVLAASLAATRGSAQDSAAPDAAVKVARKNEARQWTDATGKFNVKARLVKLAGGAVHLEKADGTAAVVPLAKLSEKDQKFIQRFFAEQDKAAPIPKKSDEPAEKTAGDLAAQTLQEMDTDRDGSVSFAEFIASRNKEFKSADVDGDGFLTIPEMEKHIAAFVKNKLGLDLPLPPGAGVAVLAPLDTNQDDKISAAEFLHVGRDSFEKLDLNRDGKFDKSEIQKGVLEMTDLTK